jgi:BMFP domain-containing protein YqiC
MLSGMDLVQREEFEAVREMAIKARDENEALAKRIEELEKKHGAAT